MHREGLDGRLSLTRKVVLAPFFAQDLFETNRLTITLRTAQPHETPGEEAKTTTFCSLTSRLKATLFQIVCQVSSGAGRRSKNILTRNLHLPKIPL